MQVPSYPNPLSLLAHTSIMPLSLPHPPRPPPSRSSHVHRVTQAIRAAKLLISSTPPPSVPRGVTYPDLQNKARYRVRAALKQSSFPSVPSEFQKAIDSGAVRESIQTGTCPRWTSASPTTLTCMLICIRAWPGSAGLPSPGFSPTTCSRRVRACHHQRARLRRRWGRRFALRGCQCHSR